MNATVERTIRTVLDLPASFELRPELRLYEDLGVDSLLLMAIVVGIETEIKAEFSPEAINRMTTIADVVKESSALRTGSGTGAM